MPVALVVAGANVPDMKYEGGGPDAGCARGRSPAANRAAAQHLCLDKGYDYDLPRFAAEQRGYLAYVRPRGEDRAHARPADPTKRPRRWVVERLHSWLNRSRRLLVRWEKLERTYLAFVQLACALQCFRACDRLTCAVASCS